MFFIFRQRCSLVHRLVCILLSSAVQVEDTYFLAYTQLTEVNSQLSKHLPSKRKINGGHFFNILGGHTIKPLVHLRTRTHTKKNGHTH